MSIVNILKEKGYTLKKGFIAADTFYPTQNSTNPFNWFRLVAVTPTKEEKNVISRLDEPIYFGIEKIKTTRRELISEIYNPTSEEWALYEFGYSSQTKKYLDSIKANCGFVKRIDAELGDSSFVDIINPVLIKSFLNAEVNVGIYNFVRKAHSFRCGMDST